MFDEKAVRESVERARRNIAAMGGKKPGDVQIAEDLAMLILLVLPDLTDQAIQARSFADDMVEKLTGMKLNREEMYTAKLTMNWLRKQAMYLALEVLQNVTD